MTQPLETKPYKGTRDFYPEDMAIQRHIFDTWSQAVERFGFVRYDASVLEPAELYRAKGAVNSEMADEQTYTFTDRGDREVTLRPEMTPSVARMIAGRRREITLPARWYSIPNLFRYEQTQRGRLREHWQLNCDIFGGHTLAGDVEIVLLATRIFQSFGAKLGTHFTIEVSSRHLLNEFFNSLSLTDLVAADITRLADRKAKLPPETFTNSLQAITTEHTAVILQFLNATDLSDLPVTLTKTDAFINLKHLITTLAADFSLTVNFNPTIVRGFDYYTGLVFEVMDTHPDNNRSLMGGGRYDNLTGLFGGESITGVGFGLGDVTMRIFLESHGLLNVTTNRPDVMVLPVTDQECLPAGRIADQIRQIGLTVVVDTSDRKLGKKLTGADNRGADYVIVLGPDEMVMGQLTLKNLATGEKTSGSLDELLIHLNPNPNQS